MDRRLAAFIGGFVAAEGCFTSHRPSADSHRFRFSVGLGAVDRSSCELLASTLRVGGLHESPRRADTYDDEVTFAVQSLRELVEVVVPFMDEWLPPSHKRDQYVAWRATLLDYWEHKAKRRRRCVIEGCGNERRAKGLCRVHYYERFGR
jgi:hypothetical protein